MLIDRRLVANFDWGLFGATVLIPSLAMVVLYSAGYDPEAGSGSAAWLPMQIESPTALRQFYFLLAGLVVMLLAASIPTSFLKRYSYLFYGLCVAALVAVLVFGTVSHGSRRWFAFGWINLQPAEPMKAALIITLARWLSQVPPPVGGYRVKGLIVPAIITLVPMALIMKQPDLGTALAIGGVGAMMILFMGVRPKTLGIITATGLLLIVPAWQMLHGYQKRRIMALFNPEADAQGAGWHVIQSKIAIGSGGLFGKGYLQGTQSQLQFLPEHTTDFIFSVLAEEWGFVGAVVMLVCYLYLLWRLLRVAQKSNSVFAALIVFGVAAHLFFHVMVNVGMVLGLLPVVGLPLPLFSYGGSSMLSTMLALGLAQGISMRRLLFSAR